MSSAVIVVAKKERLREFASSLCELLSERPAIEADVVRDAFTTTDVDQVVPVPGHTHASAASLRTAATNFASNIAQYCGGRVYVVGMSKSDQRKDMRGSRQWYWAKDVNADNKHDCPQQDDVRYLCDVDYYIDMPRFLAAESKPVLLYTVVPETAVASGIDDTSFRFEADGSLTTNVAGGGRYRHFLWNYGFDSMLACQTWFGIPVKVISYAVERKQVGKHRQVILLSPIRIFKGLAACLAHWLLEAQPLERFNPIVETSGGPFVRFNVHDQHGNTCVSTARAGTWLCANVPASVDDSVATVARLGTTNLMLPTTASWIKDDRAASAVLTEYHRLSTKRSALMVFPLSKSVRAYQYKPREFDPEAKPKLQAFMSPLVHAAFAPVLNKAGEEQCVAGRIDGLKKPEPRPSRFRDRCIDEFANLVVQNVHLEPVCYEVVALKQTSAAQRISLTRAVLTGSFRALILKCFGKAEAYSDVKDPRNISTYNDADKLDMAQFALALSEHCKRFDWYGPGKTPLEIAHRVAEVCLDAEYVNISDYHRMDGTISYTLRRVERAVCMKAFACHRAKLNELLKTNVDNKGRMPFGTTFDQGSSHGSGCSATSLFQTLRAAFTAYLAYRNKSLPGGKRLSPEEAFASLGVHLGDDGLDANLPEASHLWAATSTGLILEAQMVQRGDRGVNFLARYYSPEVWEGSLNSMCDVKRQLSKLHTTVRLPNSITPEQKLVEKAMSYVATDGNTPVIGPFCKRVLLLSPYRPKCLLGIGNWWSKFDDSVQYPNENVGGWMDVEYAALFEEFDRTQFNEWLDGTHQIEALLSAPLCAEPRAATPTVVDVVVDEDVLSIQAEKPSRSHHVGKKRDEPEEEAQSETPQRRPRRRGVKKGRGKGTNKSPQA